MKRLFLIFFASLLHFVFYAGVSTVVVIPSIAMKKDIKCTMILPESYSSSENSYPVLYLLHGYSGDYTSWLNLAPQLLEAVDMYQMIIVCPDGGFRSWYLDSPVDPSFKYETYIANEVVPWVTENYRVLKNREKCAIAGLSMGGHGALYLAVRHKDIFGAAGSMSGGVDIRQFTTSWDLKERILGDTICCKQNWEDHTVYNVIDNLRPNELSLMIDCGQDDFFMSVNRSLHEKLNEMGIAHDYIERPGAHKPAYWMNSIDYQLLFFHKYFISSTP
jgi:S-formylglutathione hydrolase FrmB